MLLRPCPPGGAQPLCCPPHPAAPWAYPGLVPVTSSQPPLTAAVCPESVRTAGGRASLCVSLCGPRLLSNQGSQGQPCGLNTVGTGLCTPGACVGPGPPWGKGEVFHAFPRGGGQGNAGGAQLEGAGGGWQDAKEEGRGEEGDEDSGEDGGVGEGEEEEGEEEGEEEEGQEWVRTGGEEAGEPLAPGLYLVGTPIGNLEDITLRALRVLRQADLVLAEDTRHSAKLLRHYHIPTPMMSFHQFNSAARRPQVLERLRRGLAVALISDAGMPAISDPGADLVRACADEGLPVVPIPGPSAVVTAVAVSGFTVSREFAFLGFPPEKGGPRGRRLEGAALAEGAQVLFASPHKLLAILGSCREAFGPSRRCLVARELTKRHEELWRGTLAEAVEEFGSRNIRGEVTLVIEGAPGGKGRGRGVVGGGSEEDVEGEVQRQAALSLRLTELLQSGSSTSDAAKAAVLEFGVRKKDAYALALSLSSTADEGS